MKLPHALAVFILIPFVIGILLGFYLHWDLSVIYKLTGGLFLFFIGAFLRERKLFLQDCTFGIAAFLLLVALGILNVKWHQPQNLSQHYIHQNLKTQSALRLIIRQRLKPSSYQDRYIAEVKRIQQKKSSGKILLTIDRDSTTSPLQVDDCIMLHSQLQAINRPSNPFQFDYAAYMAKKQVLKQTHIASGDFIKLHSQPPTLRGWAAGLRQKIDQRLEESAFSSTQIALIQALILGQRSKLSKETYTHFTEAGVVHVLAVSGLHIGILLFFLLLILKPLTYLPGGRIIRSCLLILLLWSYALVVGLSPSILRAVSMFSFLSLGLFFKRKVFTINMLCLSALVLLLYQPGFIRLVGFQLSYAAVLAILLFQNKIFSLFHFPHKITRYFWRIASVTLAAQFGVLPFSLFYFHQFPGLFFLSNLVILPFLGIIIGMGVVLLIGICFTPLPDFLITMYGGILDLLQGMVDWVADKDVFLIRHIYFSPQMLFLSLLSFALLAFMIYRKHKIYRLLFFMAFLLLQADYLYEYNRIRRDRNFYIFHKSRRSVFGFQTGHNLQLVVRSSKGHHAPLKSSFLTGLQNARGIEALSIKPFLQNYYSLGNQQIMIIDSSAIWKLPKPIQPTAIVLTQSPKINLERVVETLHPQTVIADGSNYKSRIGRWKKTCSEQDITFYYTGKQGAYKVAY